jgi:hypothetical protein
VLEALPRKPEFRFPQMGLLSSPWLYRPRVIPAAARLHARGRCYLSAGGSRNRY